MQTDSRGHVLSRDFARHFRFRLVPDPETFDPSLRDAYNYGNKDTCIKK